MPADPSLLVDLPLFDALDAEERALLADAVDIETLAEGTVLFKAGEPGQTMFVVTRGELELSVTDHAGQKIVLTVAGPGDVFGELALLDAGPRTATAVALCECELLALDRGDLLMLFTRRPESALHLLGAMGAMTRKADMLLRTRVADWIANFSGSVGFLVLNVLWFGSWIGLNELGIWRFDPYPFGLLTMIVSLQAIFLSIFMLLAQNRQAAKDRIRSDVEYEINVKAELEVAHLHEKIDGLREDLLARLERLESRSSPPFPT